MENDWKKEFVLDFRALGSWIFFLIVIIRASIGPYYLFISQLIISGLIIFIISLFYKEFDSKVSKILILAVFSSLFYNSFLFSIFAGILVLILAFASIKFSSKKNIILGIFIGIISTLIAYFGSNYLEIFFNFF